MKKVPVPGFEGHYEAHDNGHIWSVKRQARSGKGMVLRTYGGRYLKEGFTHSGTGYKQVTLCKDGKLTYTTVHKLIALCFLGRNTRGAINHKDGNKNNNVPGNLEYVTHQENIDHAVKSGLINTKGKNNPNYRHGRYVV